MFFSLRAWKQNSSGSIAIIFALSVLPATLAIGVGVDYSHAVGARARLQAATDALAQATLRAKSLGTFTGTSASASNTSSGTNPELESYFTSNFVMPSYQDYNWWSWTGTTDAPTGKYTVTSRAGIKTAFMQSIGISEMTSQASSTVSNNQTIPEVVLVVDVSQSISSSKLTAMKTSITSMLDSFITQYGATGGVLKFSLVPFEDVIAVPSGYNNSSNSWWIAFENGASSFGGCIAGRGNENANSPYHTTNELPTSGNSASKYFGDDYSSCYTDVTPIMALTNNLNTAKTTVNNLIRANYPTNIPAGLLWGWNMLTPGLPVSNGTSTSGVNRYVILLAGGPNIDQADYGVSSLSQLNTRMSTLCTNMKNDNKRMFTIRYMAGDATLLSGCATSSTTDYFNATSNSSLTTAMTSIASTIISENQSSSSSSGGGGGGGQTCSRCPP